jgi:hypothetical protein
MSLSHRIGDVFSILGSPHYRAAVRSFDEPFVHRASWTCGCVVDYIHEEVGAFEWGACAAHSPRSAQLPKVGLPSFISG